MSAIPPLDVDLLRTFVLIADGGSFTRAAERVGRSQPAVSLQVQRLESLVGHRLFTRGKGGGAQLTPHGERLLERAREMTALNDSIVGSLRASPEAGPAASAGTAAADLLSAPSAPSKRPTIAVLPFHNMSDDSDQDYFVDGMVDDLITGLSRIKSLVVIARNSSFTYKGRRVDVRQVGRELGVRYVLLGGVRRAGSRLRVNAQLLDAGAGTLLWADRYDGPLEDVFALQDRIVDQVVAMVEPNLQRSEIDRARRKRTTSLDAYDLYLRALPHAASRMPAGTAIALPLLEQALKLEPDYPAAQALAAWCCEWRFTRGGFAEENRKAALEHAETVIAGDTDDAAALAIAGFVTSILSGEDGCGLDAVKRALWLNGSSATVLYLASHAHAIADENEAATSIAGRALRLSPFDPFAFEAHMALGDVAMREERYEDAAACFARSARTNPAYSTAHFFRGMAAALAGRVDDAGPMVRRGLALEPDFRARIVYEVGMTPAVSDQFVEGARRLGLKV